LSLKTEGELATLKSYLQRGHGNLKGEFKEMMLLETAQHAPIQLTIAQLQLRPTHAANIPLFTAILKHVHGRALQKILPEHAQLPARGAPFPVYREMTLSPYAAGDVLTESPNCARYVILCTLICVNISYYLVFVWFDDILVLIDGGYG
jgi:hypothetical protein